MYYNGRVMILTAFAIVRLQYPKNAQRACLFPSLDLTVRLCLVQSLTSAHPKRFGVFLIAAMADGSDGAVVSAHSRAAADADVVDLSDDVEPGERCAVCLESVSTRTCLDKCFHEFCHACILQWSEVSRQCPLCKTSYSTLIYEIKSDADYQTVWLGW